MLFDEVGEAAHAKTRLEVLLDILSTVRSIDFAKKQLPQIPEGCKPSLVEMAKFVHRKAFREGGDLPSVICESLESNAHKTCLGDLLINLDKVEWVAQSIGNGHLHVLMKDILDPLCGAVRKAQGISISIILESLPDVIHLYQQLDSALLQDLLPGVHSVLLSCNQNLTATARAIALSYHSISKLAGTICSHVAGDSCLIQLSHGLDNLTFVVEAIGEGTLEGGGKQCASSCFAAISTRSSTETRFQSTPSSLACRSSFKPSSTSTLSKQSKASFLYGQQQPATLRSSMLWSALFRQKIRLKLLVG